MSNEFIVEFKSMVFLFFIMFIIIVFFALIFQYCRISIHPNVVVFVDKKLIYRGSDCCVDIISSGFNTTVKTSKFLCIFPDKSYTSKDVVVESVE